MSIRDFIKQVLPQKLTWAICNSIPHKPLLWDIAKSERLCEYAWAISRIYEPGNVLDIGYVGSLFPQMLASLGNKVWAIDKKKMKIYHPNLVTKIINISDMDTYPDFFDYITVISTLEHTKSLDKICLDKCYNAIKPEGLVLLTVPVGKPAQFKGYKVYSRNQISDMWQGFIQSETYFKELRKGVWDRCELKDVRDIVMEEKGDVKSIGCFALTK